MSFNTSVREAMARRDETTLADVLAVLGNFYRDNMKAQLIATQTGDVEASRRALYDATFLRGQFAAHLEAVGYIARAVPPAPETKEATG